MINETILARAFTEWERRFREEPQRFMDEHERLAEPEDTIGELQAKYLLVLMAELDGGATQVLPDRAAIAAQIKDQMKQVEPRA